jgi:hypothetical protein
MRISVKTERICALVALFLIYQNIPTGWCVGFATGVVGAVFSLSACVVILIARNWNYDTMRSTVIMAGEFLRGQEKFSSFDFQALIVALSPLLSTIFSRVKSGGSTIPPPQEVVRPQQTPPEVKEEETKKVVEIENESDDESEQKITDVTTSE